MDHGKIFKLTYSSYEDGLYDIYFEYNVQNDGHSIVFRPYFSSKKEKLQKIVDLDDQKIVLEGVDGTVNGMCWYCEVVKENTTISLDSTCGGSSQVILNIPTYFLADELRSVHPDFDRMMVKPSKK
jgi:hypothetical protein